MLKISELKKSNIFLSYLIFFIILIIISFYPFYSYDYKFKYNGSYIYESGTYYGLDFTWGSLIFYLIAIILLYKAQINPSIVLTVIGNAILGITLFYLIYEFNNPTKGFSYVIEFGFYLIFILWILLTCLNIYLIVVKKKYS